MPTTATLSFACLICHLVFYTVPSPWEVLDKVCRVNKRTSEIQMQSTSGELQVKARVKMAVRLAILSVCFVGGGYDL